MEDPIGQALFFAFKVVGWMLVKLFWAGVALNKVILEYTLVSYKDGRLLFNKFLVVGVSIVIWVSFMPFVFLMFDSNSNTWVLPGIFFGAMLGVAAAFLTMREWDIERLFLPPSSEPDEYDLAEPPIKLTRPVQNKQADSSDVQKAVDDLVAQLDEQ